MRDRMTMLAYRSAARVTQALPERMLSSVGRVGGRIGGLPQKGDSRMAARHHHRVKGADVPRAVDRVFECYGRYWLEMFRLPHDVRAGVISENFVADGYDNITDGLARGHGVILALPHLGGWEWAAAWMAE